MDALPAEASCPICLEFFRDPVSIHCGHHFCRACIERCWEWPTDRFACPRCRDTAPQRSLRPSPELARVLEIARRLSRGEALGGDEEEEEEGEEGCRRHREPLEVFCRQDGALLCAICRESRAHRAHDRARLQTLKDDRDKLLEFREAEMRRNWEFLVNASERSAAGWEKTEAERQRILSHFQGLRLALEELSRHLLARLGRLEGDIATVQDENVTGLTQEISRLDARVQELEEKCEQPARTFLQVRRGRGRGNSGEKLQLPPSPLPELEKKIHRFREENILLEETLRSFQGIGSSTAHPQLLVAPDGSSVSWESGVTAGRRCWDVRVTPEGSWALGVATETPGSGGETLGSGGETPRIFWALTSLERIPLFPVRAPGRVRVALDYERGQVAFFDADQRSLIFAFPAGHFRGTGHRGHFSWTFQGHGTPGTILRDISQGHGTPGTFLRDNSQGHFSGTF
uniref:TRI27 protein n=1 Tax=Catharus ustulatus TaxID=91951 RepID=A0A8C3UH15_CATUS